MRNLGFFRGELDLPLVIPVIMFIEVGLDLDATSTTIPYDIVTDFGYF